MANSPPKSLELARRQRLLEASAWLRRLGDAEGAQQLLAQLEGSDWAPAPPTPDALPHAEVIEPVEVLFAESEALPSFDATDVVEPTQVDFVELAPPAPKPTTLSVAALGAKPLATQRHRVDVHWAGNLMRSIILTHDITHVGTASLGIELPELPQVAPHHASLFVRRGQLFVRDGSSRWGTFVAIAREERLELPTQLRAGQRLFWLQPGLDATPLLVDTLTGEQRRIGPTPLRVGQARCDWTLGDAALAPAHFELVASRYGTFITDCSDGLGTFTRLPSGAERMLTFGDRLWLGGFELRIERLPS